MDAEILIVDDEKKVRKITSSYLEEAGFTVREASRGDEALELVYEEEPDLLILDLMLPGMSGEEVAEDIRSFSDLPIIMLTARSSEEERIEGFARGADDYVVKPFSPRELVARVKANLKRFREFYSDKSIYIGDFGIEVLPEAGKVKVDGEDAGFTAVEYQLFKVLLEHRGQILSRDQLVRKARGIDYEGFDRTVDVHIKNIRKKLDLSKDELIETVYGMGYRFEDEIDYEKS